MPRIDFFATKDVQPVANPKGPTLRANRSCLTTAGRLLSLAMTALTIGDAPAFAVEQCRFIQARAEREACYQRQEAELAARRKVEPRQDKTMQALEQMKHEDEALNRQIHGICRGC